MRVRAEIAGYNFDFIGCDDIVNAPYIARFSCEEETVDCRITVERQMPQFPPLEAAQTLGEWKRLDRSSDVVICHRSRAIMLTITDDFRDMHIWLSPDFEYATVMQYLLVQQMVSAFLLLHDGGMIHSAAVRVNEQGILLCGRSGVGKSTMARLLCENNADTAVLCEEMPAFTQTESGFLVHGTPFCGDGDACSPLSAPLSACILLRQASRNCLRAIPSDEAMFELLSLVTRPVYLPQVAQASVDRLTSMFARVPVLLFENDGTPEAAQALRTYIHTELRDI